MADENLFQDQGKEYVAKSLIYYEHLLGTFISSRNEHDKALFIVSIGGVGLLTTLLTTVKLSFISVILLILAIITFLIATIAVIETFSVDAAYVSYLLDNFENEAAIENKKLKTLKIIAKYSLFIGIFLAFIVGITSSFYKLNEETKYGRITYRCN